MEPYWQGYNAQVIYDKGEGPAPACPFPPDSEDAEQWAAGVQQAMEDA